MKRAIITMVTGKMHKARKRRLSPASHLHKIAITILSAQPRIYPCALKTRALIDPHSALIERQHVQPEIVGLKVFSGKIQPRLHKGQAQPFARQIRSHTQANSYRFILAI